ncbi:uncharacterized protein JCM6883_005998 [Sporobolomyces salmoneus]|uniref:uncharacterized protein n=1 Tax=Sporobolomyces salmoneus TaxID=183962 RepID=UPI00317DFDF1
MTNTSKLATSHSPSSAPSEGTAPLLASEDLHSLSSSDEATSDWSSPSDASDVGDLGEEEEEEDDGFDLLASQELRQLPSDSSKSTTSSSGSSKDLTNSRRRSRMTLSFPDPIATSPATDSEGDAVPREGGSSIEPLSPTPSSTKVRADLDNSILIDGGSYSLLLDAPVSTTTRPPIGGGHSSNEQGEEEITSTPPPSSLPAVNLPAPPSGFVRSYSPLSSPSSSIVRVSKRAEDKVGKWRSTLTPTPTPPPISRESDSREYGAVSVEDSTQDISSVNSSQTVRPTPSSPLNRSVLSSSSTQLDISPESPSVYDEKKKNEFDSGSRKALDRISKSSPSSARQGGMSWWNRVMIGVTVMGVVLAGVGTLSIRRGDLVQPKQEVTVPRAQVVETKGNVSAPSSSSVGRPYETPTASISLTVTDDNEASPISHAVSQSSSPSFSSSTLPHTLPTAEPPLSLDQPSIPLSSTASLSTASQLNTVATPSSSSSSSPFPSALVYRIDPPYSLISPSNSPPPRSYEPVPRLDNEDVSLTLKERMIQHASRCRDYERRIEKRLVGNAKRGTRRIRRKLRARRRDAKRKEKGKRTIVRIQDRVEDSPEDTEECDDAGRLSGVDMRSAMKAAWDYVGGIERKWEEEIRKIVRDTKFTTRQNLERYPLVKDYYRSKKQDFQSRIGSMSRNRFEGIARKLRSDVKGRTAELVSLAKSQAGVTRRLVGAGFERAEVGKKWKEIMKKGERHVRRAAKVVKKIEKRDYWEVRREERKKRRERKRQRSEEKSSRKRR